MKISIGHSRKDINWKPKEYSWQQLCEKLSKTVRTSETVAEYLAMSKDDKSAKKDIGGFVGGVIRGGRRTKGNVVCRTLITLDADFATQTSWTDATMLNEYAMCCYSTHSHRPTSPRLRYVIPLDRQVTPEEYEPIARRIAADLGIEQFDTTTYETSRLMYWPSTPSDGEFVFEKQDGAMLSADAVLARYDDWHDTTAWPIGSTETKVRAKQLKAQGDPRGKRGSIGLFCRTYTMHDAIAKFLPDVYVQCDTPNRYTYAQGSTSAGVVIYDDTFAYSHHSTDPAGGQLCNAFDLVRLHKFGELDYEQEPDTPVTKLPSYKAMCEFVSKDDESRQQAVEESRAAVDEAFGGDDLNWAKRLEIDKTGAIKATVNNIRLIFENDVQLSGAFALNEFTGKFCLVKDVPWRKCDDSANGIPWKDADEAELRCYLEKVYGIYNVGKTTDAIDTTMLEHAFHPVRSYLTSLTWDEVPRGESLLINYLGADDTDYTKAVTRKWLTAAVARIMRPGCKFDNMLVLVGEQGIGKSFLGKKLGQRWFSDTLLTVQGKEALESLRGVWIMEMGELSAMKKAEVESVKMFVSKQTDTYRAAYAKNSETHDRQCVFYGTTNDYEFLRDATGNRRFWPVACKPKYAKASVFDLTDYDIDQIWAEATNWYMNGEELWLSPELSKKAMGVQAQFQTEDPRLGEIAAYLDTPIPITWEEFSKEDRRNYIQGFLEYDGQTVARTRVSVVELAYELYGKKLDQAWQAKEYSALMRQVSGWECHGRRSRLQYYGTQRVFERCDDADT